jgi:pantoate--beta-alanine ligase
MIIAKSKEELDKALKQLSLKPGKLALIPTMGNLHEGHLSLVKMAKLHSSKTITTIFVNPLQFGKNEDFNEYPRTIETDVEKLKNENCDVLFIPKNKNEMFDDKTKPKQIESGELGKELCGKIRPDHFDGVLTVVYRMFYIINPDIAIFGAKRFIVRERASRCLIVNGFSVKYCENDNILMFNWLGYQTSKRMPRR